MTFIQVSTTICSDGFMFYNNYAVDDFFFHIKKAECSASISRDFQTHPTYYIYIYHNTSFCNTEKRKDSASSTNPKVNKV